MRHSERIRKVNRKRTRPRNLTGSFVRSKASATRGQARVRRACLRRNARSPPASLGSSAVWGTFNARIAVPANVRGNVTLELYEASPKDGTAQGVVRVPLAVR